MMHSDHSGLGHSHPTRLQTTYSFDSRDLQSIAQSIEQVMAQLLVVEQKEDVQSMSNMARHCWELLYEPREQLRAHARKGG